MSNIEWINVYKYLDRGTVRRAALVCECAESGNIRPKA